MDGGKPASAVAPLKLRFADSLREKKKKRKIVLPRMSYTTFSFTVALARVNETRCVFHMQNFTTRLEDSILFFFYRSLLSLRPRTISIRRCARSSSRDDIPKKEKRDEEVRGARCREK